MAAPSGLFSLTTIPGWSALQQRKAPPAAAAAAAATSSQRPAAWVRTDEDVVAYFERGGPIEFFYAIRADDEAEAEAAPGGVGREATAAQGGLTWDAAAAEFFLKAS